MRIAIAMWVRSDWRRRARSLVALTLLTAVAGGFVLLALAGARRAATSFDRLARATQASDVLVDVGSVDPEISAEIAALPMVENSGAFTIVFAIVEGIEIDLGLWLPRDDRFGNQIETDRLLRGRRPLTTHPDEVAIDETTAASIGLDVGDRVSIATLSPTQVKDERYFPAEGPVLALRVVGVVRSPDDLISRVGGRFVASAALYDVVHGRVDEFTTYLAMDLHDDATLEEFGAAVDTTVPDDQAYDTLTFDARARAARGAISAIAWGLAVFATVAAVFALIVVGQAVGRHVASARRDQEAMQYLGVTRSARRFGLTLTAAPIAIGGALFAPLFAWLASPLMPVGLARRAEPDSGLSADWTVLSAGALAVGAVVVLSAALAAAWLTSPPRAARIVEPSRLADAIANAGAGPSAVTGVRLALDRRPPPLPVRSAIAGVFVAVVGATAALTFSASLGRLLDSPDRWGYGWDLLLDFSSDAVGEAADQIVDDRRFVAVARWDAGFSYLNGEGIRAFGLDPLAGDLGFSLRSGRQPVAPSEVVLGPDTAARLKVTEGDQVMVARDGTTAEDPVAVVGTALFPDGDGDGSLTDAVGYYAEGFERYAAVPDLFEASQIVVRVVPGLDLGAAVVSLEEQYPGSASSAENLPSPPGAVANLAGVRSLPRWLALILALLALVSLAHVLLTTVWRRRTDLATLRSLGFTSRQMSMCLVSQAVTITVIGTIAAVPFGIAAGNLAWFLVSEPIGVAPDALRPVVALGATAAVAVVTAALTAIGPGWYATRGQPADAMRTE